MIQIIYRQSSIFASIISRNNSKVNDLVRVSFGGNISSDTLIQNVVPKTTLHVKVLYKYNLKAIHSDEKTNSEAEKKATYEDGDTTALFTIIVKKMKNRLHIILNTIYKEPHSIIEYMSWRLRQLMLSAIITTGVSFSENCSVKTSSSGVHRFTSSMSGHLFSRPPLFGMDQFHLARSATMSVSTNLVAHFCTSRCSNGGKTSGGLQTRDRLIKTLLPNPATKHEKVTVVGIGQVGMAAIIAMLTQNVSNDIAMIDMNMNKLKGETLDLLHGSLFVNNPTIQGSTDYAISSGSSICIITAGVRQKAKQTRLDIVNNNTELYKKMIPELIKHCPNTVFVIATNPVDILTYVAWKISGLPKHRVIGSGTLLDSARFRYLIAQKLGIATTSVSAYIIGEHGNSMVPVWSEVNIAGVRLSEINPKIGSDDDPENWKELHAAVMASGYDVRTLKGFTSWAIGLSIAKIVSAILANSNRVFAVSTYVKGVQGINDEIFLSLPSVLCREGVRDIIQLVLTNKENEDLQKSAKLLADLISQLKI